MQHQLQYRRSKEKRNDAKLIVPAVVINPEGFIKCFAILEGNVADCKTLEEMHNMIRIKTSVMAKKAKENSMNEQFRSCFEAGLQKIANRLIRKGGMKK